MGRKAYHEPVSLARQLRGTSWTKTEIGLVESHLMAGFGHYHHVMIFLAEYFGWDKKKSGDESEPGLDGWVEGAVHRCLVCLGDLARYQLELGLGLSAQPARYYQLAVTLRPEGGVPYNQLAMLCGEENFGLEQLFYYMRCVTSKGGFGGGETNLRRLLDKRAAVYE